MPPPAIKPSHSTGCGGRGGDEIRPENPLLLLPSARSSKLTLGCPLLDRLLGGGLPAGSVTELAGESATGKTQLCIQLALAALLPTYLGGLAAASLFLHSELPFPLRRLRGLPFPAHLLPPNSRSPLDHVLVAAAHSPPDLVSLLSRAAAFLARPPPASRHLPIKLIVVDSIAALFRAEFDNTPAELRRRSGLFFRIAAKLKELAHRHGCVVVVTNQVVDVVEGGDGGGGGGNAMWSSGRRVCPALGLAWANCVNTRIFLSRGEEAGGARTRRWMRVVFAPHLPEGACEFAVRKDGVFGIETAESCIVKKALLLESDAKDGFNLQRMSL